MKKDNLKIQDLEKTNVILKSNDINSSNISIKDTCGILKVDGVLFSKFSVFTPMPIDNDVIATLSLKDCSIILKKRGGRKGEHSEAFGYLLSDLQYMQRAYPNSSW